jgi:hypothetical protein
MGRQIVGDDELAVHTVAAAGYRILRDLLEKRGKNDLEEVVRTGIFTFAKDLASERLSREEIDAIKRDHEMLFPLLLRVAEDIKFRGDHAARDAITARLSEQQKRTQWKEIGRSANFLKHADIDQYATINLRDIDNETLLTHASVAYTFFGQSMTDEMGVFAMLSMSSSKERQTDVDGPALEIIKKLTIMTPKKRRRVCLKLLREWKRHK